MAAPTEGQNIKKTLANGEPSTHGAKRTLVRCDKSEVHTVDRSTNPCTGLLRQASGVKANSQMIASRTADIPLPS
jgi:hypothetical protein